MIKYSILTLIVIFFIEIIRILKIKDIIISLLINIKKFPSILKRSISNEKLENLYFEVSKKILFASVKILLFLFTILIFLGFIYYMNNDFFNFIIRIQAAFEILLIGFVYLKIKNFYARKL